MSNPTEIVSRWIDSPPERVLIRSLDLEQLVNHDQASRQLSRLTRHGRLMRVARGLYVAVTASRFGPIPPPVDKIVQSLASITGYAIVRHGAAAANALSGCWCWATDLPVMSSELSNGSALTLPSKRLAS